MNNQCTTCRFSNERWDNKDTCGICIGSEEGIDFPLYVPSLAKKAIESEDDNNV